MCESQPAPGWRAAPREYLCARGRRAERVRAGTGKAASMPTRSATRRLARRCSLPAPRCAASRTPNAFVGKPCRSPQLTALGLGSPPVRLGAQCGHAEVAKHLIADKADVNTCIKSGASALYTACFRVSAALVKFGEGMLAAEYARACAGPCGRHRVAPAERRQREQGQEGWRDAALRRRAAVRAQR